MHYKEYNLFCQLTTELIYTGAAATSAFIATAEAAVIKEA